MRFCKVPVDVQVLLVTITCPDGVVPISGQDLSSLDNFV